MALVALSGFVLCAVVVPAFFVRRGSRRDRTGFGPTRDIRRVRAHALGVRALRRLRRAGSDHPVRSRPFSHQAHPIANSNR